MAHSIVRVSTVTCPVCGAPRLETMPGHLPQVVYYCFSCGESSWKRDGDCCVYCSYGSVPCPVVQRRQQEQ